MLKQSSSEEKQVSSKTLKMFFDSESVWVSIHKTEIRSCTTETQASDLLWTQPYSVIRNFHDTL